MSTRPLQREHPVTTASRTGGDDPLPGLAGYHRTHGEFLPPHSSLWETVLGGFRPGDPPGVLVNQNETDHVRHWQQRGKDLTPPENTPPPADLVAQLSSISLTTLLGFLEAFALHRPKVARIKREGRATRHGVDRTGLAFFDEHEKGETGIHRGRQRSALAAHLGESQQWRHRGPSPSMTVLTSMSTTEHSPTTWRHQ